MSAETHTVNYFAPAPTCHLPVYSPKGHHFSDIHVLTSFDLYFMHPNKFYHFAFDTQYVTWNRHTVLLYRGDTSLWIFLGAPLTVNGAPDISRVALTGIWLCFALQWRHNEGDGVSNHQPHDCLLICLFNAQIKENKTSASLAFVRGIHRWAVNPPHKGPVTRKMFPLVTSSWLYWVVYYQFSMNSLDIYPYPLGLLCWHLGNPMR